MPRVKRGPIVRARHKKLLNQTKGFRHGRKNLFRRAKEALIRSGQYAYRDRRVKKRDFRQSWIATINAAIRPYDLNYNQFIHGLNKSDLNLDRKVLAELAQTQPDEFAKVVEKVKTGLK